jgi:hypothetical protein
MGTIQHDLVAFTFDSDKIPKVGKWIEEHVPAKYIHLFAISPPCSNGYSTIVMFPDGSKEGWETSNDADDIREQFIAWAQDHLSHLEGVHARYGELGSFCEFYDEYQAE